MAGVLHQSATMENMKLRLGYRTLLYNDARLKGHEFHFSTLEYGEGFPWAYNLQGSRQKEGHLEGYSNKNILASYLHLSFDGNPKAGEKLIESCEHYHCSKEGK